MTKSNSSGQLRSFVERIERLNAEKSSLTEDIKSIYAEAAGAGFDKPALREIVRMRKADAAKLAEHEAIIDTYKSELGMLIGTPLGDAAVRDAAMRIAARLRKHGATVGIINQSA